MLTSISLTLFCLIDNIFTNDIGDTNNSVQGLFISDISDHFPVFHIARLMEIKEKDTYIFKRLYSFQNKENFCQAMSNISWDEISRTRATQQAFDTFHKHLVAIYNKHFPKIRIKRKYSNRMPWLSEGLKNSIKQKKKLYLKLKKVNSAPNDELYKSYKIKLQQLITVAEKHHYHDLLIKYSNNMKKILGCHNKANLRDLIAAIGLVISLKFDPNHRFFVPCDLEIWWMTLENNRAPRLYYIKLCASFQIHR